MTNKFVKKYMRFAKLISSDQIPCLSRGIGTVIVNPLENRIVSTGYNGPPKGVPHCDSHEYLEQIVYPQLTDAEKKTISDGPGNKVAYSARNFANHYNNCGNCPRRLVGAKSGQRLELCSCAHSEQNAVIQAGPNAFGGYLFCWCGPPCFDICAKAIINAGIKRVYALKRTDSAYNQNKTRWLFEKSGIELFELSEEWINDEN